MSFEPHQGMKSRCPKCGCFAQMGVWSTYDYARERYDRVPALRCLCTLNIQIVRGGEKPLFPN